MKVLIYRYGSICEPDVIEGFKELGLEVIEETAEISKKSMTMQEQIKLVSDRLISSPVDFVFSINFYPTLSEVCNIHHIPYLSWTVDSPVMELYTKSITNPCNRTFIFDYEDYAELEPLNPGHIFHLPLAATVKTKDEAIKNASQADLKRFSHDVSFVGSLYTEKNPYSRLQNAPAYLTGYLDGILESQLKVYGVNFMEKALTDEMVDCFKANFDNFYQLPGESFLTDKMTLARLYMGSQITAMERDLQMRALSENFDVNIYTGSDTSMYPGLHNRGFAKTLTEMPVIFKQSKINLSTTSRSIRSGISLRIWDILGAGGFCLTNYQSELFNYFNDGEHLVSYGSLEELVDKTRYYLDHENERKEIAVAGYEYVKNHHTFTIRLAQMIQMAFADLFNDAKEENKQQSSGQSNYGRAVNGNTSDAADLGYLIYLPGDMCYGVLDRFARLLGKALEKRGEQVTYFDTTGDNFTNIGQFIGKRFKAIIGFQSYMFSLKTVGGDYVHDLIEGEKKNFYFDHPIKGREHLSDCAKSVEILTLDENYVRFIEAHYGLKARFLPPAGEIFMAGDMAMEENAFAASDKMALDSIATNNAADIGTVADNIEKKYTLSFLGSYGSGFHGYLGELMKLPRERRFLYNHLFSIIRKNPDMPSEEAFMLAMLEVNKTPESIDVLGTQIEPEPTVTAALDGGIAKNNVPPVLISEEDFMDEFSGAASMLRMISHHYREKIVKTILDAGIELDVFGDSWNYSPFANHPCLKIHPEVRDDEATLVYAQSLLSLNIMSWHKGGFTERMQSAMLNGSVLVTDRSTYTDEHFTDGENMIIFSLDKLDELPGKINAALADHALMEKILGTNSANLKNYTWDAVADEI